mmetsp:Transcript_8755/g.25835  ORF Transcript_8755/g.25835 Transcript_8755/m.25835 type:complete len:263 (-) Transcript_8755:424-1212(-)
MDLQPLDALGGGDLLDGGHELVADDADAHERPEDQEEVEGRAHRLGPALLVLPEDGQDRRHRAAALARRDLVDLRLHRRADLRTLIFEALLHDREDAHVRGPRAGYEEPAQRRPPVLARVVVHDLLLQLLLLALGNNVGVKLDDHGVLVEAHLALHLGDLQDLRVLGRGALEALPRGRLLQVAPVARRLLAGLPWAPVRRRRASGIGSSLLCCLRGLGGEVHRGAADGREDLAIGQGGAAAPDLAGAAPLEAAGVAGGAWAH